MKHLLLLLVMLSFFAALAQDNIAIVYSLVGRQGVNEQAKKFENCRTELFSETEIGKLTPKLKEFDAVLIGELVGHDKPIDWSADIGAWEEYVRNGGVLIILDANYANTWKHFIGRWGTDWQLTLERCEQRSDFQKLTRLEFPENDPLLCFPFDSHKLFSELRIWSHYRTLPPGWSAFGTCPDGAAPIVRRNHGKGLVLATNAGGFTGSRQDIWRNLTLNAVAATRMRAMNIALRKFSMPTSFGEQKLILNLRCGSGVQLNGQIKLELNNLTLIDQSLDNINGSLALPYTIDEPGNLTLVMSIGTTERQVTLRRTLAVTPPVALEALFDTYRPAILAHAPFHILRDPIFAGAQMELTLDGKTVIPFQEGAWPAPTLLNLAQLPPGRHTLSASLAWRDGERFTSRPVVFEITAEDPPIMVDAEGFLVRNGKRFFPRGFYVNTLTPETIHKVKDAGYQFIHLASWNEQQEKAILSMVKSAEALDLQLIVGGSPNYLRSVCHSPRIWARDTLDEPDYHGVAPERCRELARKMREFGTEPIFMVLAKPDSLDGSFFSAADIVAHDPYPIPAQEIATVYRNLRKLAVNLQGHGKAPMGVLQCFGYAKGPFFNRVPTAAEYRNMVYQALTAGMRGLHNYTWKDDGFDLDANPELLAEVIRVGKELAQYEPYLVSSTQQEITTGLPTLFGRSWTVNGKTLTVLVNASSKPARYGDVSFTPFEVKLSEQ